MANYRARQLAVIREAIATAREVYRRASGDDPSVFTDAYIAAGGVQIPGQPRSEAAPALAERLRECVRRGEHRAGDPDLQRELDRVYREVRWAAAQDDDSIVGFFLELPESALESPTAEALSHENHGLGPGVFRKADIVVLQPDCDGARFTPVTEHDLEW